MNKIPCASQNTQVKTLPADICILVCFRRFWPFAVHSNELQTALWLVEALFVESYNFCKLYFPKFDVCMGVNNKNYDSHGVLNSFYNENWICAYFYYYIRNQRVKLRKYTDFQGNQRVHFFGTLSTIFLFHRENISNFDYWRKYPNC